MIRYSHLTIKPKYYIRVWEKCSIVLVYLCTPFAFVSNPFATTFVS